MSSEVKTGDPGPSTNLSRQTSAKSARSTLIRSTDAHPPHHAHFDIPEGPESHGGSVHSLVDMNDGSADKDEKRVSTAVGTPAHPPVVDIEHVPCDDDPREWSDRKKSMVLAMMTIAVLGPLIAPSIYNPVIDEIKAELNASDTQIGLSLSMYILLQGWMPVIWASTAEIIGRKTVYLVSTAIFFVGSLVASRANTIEVLIGMRCLQASGSAAVVAVGAGSLADIFEVHERGQKLGLFYGMPLLGPALGPLIGGALGNSFGWRSALYFLAAFAGTVFCMLLFFPDTWRKERSRVYQKAIEQAIKRAMHHDEAKEKKRQRKLAKGLSSSAPTPPATQPPSKPATRRNSIQSTEEIIVEPDRNEVTLKHKWYDPRGFRKTKTAEEHAKIQPSIRDVNPFPTMLSIFRQPTNAVILFSSGILFAAQYTIPYTASVTLAKAPYNYNALYIGLIVLSFGIGSICGSVLGGRYSDRVLRKLKKANGGVLQSEMRLRSTVVAMPLVVSAFLIYAWTAGNKVHVSGIVIALLLCGLSLMLIYSSTLAYLVDANPGRSASAVSCNSFIRGTFGAILSQVAVPIQSAIGDGGLYTILAGLLALSSGGILLLIWKGESWRSPDHTFVWQRSKRRRLAAQDETKETTSQAITTEGTTVRSSTDGSVEGKP